MHVGFWYKCCESCCFICKRTRFLLLILPLISSFFFLSNFQIYRRSICLFSGTERHTKLKLGPHMDSRLMYHVYLNQTAGVCLFLHFFNFLSLKFQNIKFLSHFSVRPTKLKLDTRIHGQRVNLLCTSTTSSQNILVPLFFFFFLSFQLAKIKKLASAKLFQHTSLLTVCYICLKLSLVP